MYRSFNDFRENEISVLVKKMLKKGQEKGQIRRDVNIDLTYELYYNRMEYIVHAENKNFYEKFTPEELLNHIIINNIRGIATKNYLEQNYSAFQL